MKLKREKSEGGIRTINKGCMRWVIKKGKDERSVIKSWSGRGVRNELVNDGLSISVHLVISRSVVEMASKDQESANVLSSCLELVKLLSVRNSELSQSFDLLSDQNLLPFNDHDSARKKSFLLGGQVANQFKVVTTMTLFVRTQVANVLFASETMKVHLFVVDLTLGKKALWIWRWRSNKANEDDVNDLTSWEH